MFIYEKKQYIISEKTLVHISDSAKFFGNFDCNYFLFTKFLFIIKSSFFNGINPYGININNLWSVEMDER